MIFDKDGTTTIVFQENIELSKFLDNLNKAYPKIKNDNIIVNLFSFSKLKADDLLEFLQLSDQHRKSNKSFVLVTNKVGYEEVPDKMIVVPTLQEAKDIIEMEEIERDLGL
ncbi:ribonuclease Z [Flavobacteriaceae bacterium TP-CH-4]|uniref:Ribonuclease Z n=1 Tax=Pelagihabitans pacificus TaxID=2696054 RepID=A0A967E5U5_9FLAO|nr:ribonuclease Z [Pelagihabitans pacificus]NHF59792.1 ribonuclease Z [Pelagihabitans pacificus]